MSKRACSACSLPNSDEIQYETQLSARPPARGLDSLAFLILALFRSLLLFSRPVLDGVRDGIFPPSQNWESGVI